MQDVLRKGISALVLLVVPFLMSGCIVFWDDPCCNPGTSPPRMAELFVYVYDYNTDAPIPWAVVELYRQAWWYWEFRGAWNVDPYGYARLQGGLLHWEGYGGPQREDYRICVHASGYYPESYEIELSYRYPSEALYFYLYPAHMARGDTGGEDAEPEPGAMADGVEHSHGLVRVGTPRGEEP